MALPQSPGADQAPRPLAANTRHTSRQISAPDLKVPIPAHGQRAPHQTLTTRAWWHRTAAASTAQPVGYLSRPRALSLWAPGQHTYEHTPLASQSPAVFITK
eukprot:CAMPEP_0194702518 /NCGR_PEP_ID=MMETSP0295-20121207/26936_1 /TAXON_ID=39354 /ORGANISM="Heterosigma akashiwo, Strain CCMP2393" /LENGTH=101 /DNA_ID=CAMNT_0039597129 /DNA_START=808 /DNA_END=1113 /DNA_ORIENTATION=+